jgi:hypothetical protein
MPILMGRISFMPHERLSDIDIPITHPGFYQRKFAKCMAGIWIKSSFIPASLPPRMIPSGPVFGQRNWPLWERGVLKCSPESSDIGIDLSVLRNGSEKTILVGQEKGIDMRLALDVIRCGRDELFDVALIFSQDQDLSKVAVEIRRIAARQKRWIKIASAFPLSPASVNKRGINRTDWIKIDKALYDSCVDPGDYRPE